MTFAILVSCGGGGNNDGTKPKKTTTETPVASEGIRLDNTALIIAVGQTQKLTAYNIETNTETLTVLWSSSDTAVATVDTKGNVTGAADGTATITASTIDGTYKASCTVTVSSVVSGVTLDQSAIELSVGTSFTLTATVLPEGISNNGVTWFSSVESVATVSSQGVVTAVGNGVTSIAAKTVDGEYTAFCTVTVTTPVKGITLSDTEMSLQKGVTGRLTYTITPIDASDKSARWSSSDESVAAVTQDGLVTGVGAGSATIKVETANGISAECTVTVSSPVTGVTVNPSSLRLSAGSSELLSAIISPTDADNQEVRWSTSNASIASVGELTGLVTANAPGTATITVTTVDGLFSATCEVTVYRPIASMTFANSNYEMKINTTLKLVLNKLPADASNEKITYVSSDTSIATVDANGTVTGLAHGTVTITATSEYGVEATCSVYVIDPAMLKVAVESVTILNGEYISLREGESFVLNVSVLPENATIKEYKITISDESVIRIGEDGKIIAVSSGIANITVTSIDDATKSDTIVVSVTALSEEEIQKAIDDYNREVAAEDKRHTDEIARLENEFKKNTEQYNKDLEALNKEIEALEAERSVKNELLNEAIRKLQEATNAGNMELVEQYTAEVASLSSDITKINSDINSKNTSKDIITGALSKIQEQNSAEKAIEDNKHNANISDIRDRYEYILKYIED